MSKPKKAEKQSKGKLFSDTGEREWRKLQRETAERARSLGITSEADIERIIHEIREQTSKA